MYINLYFLSYHVSKRPAFLEALRSYVGYLCRDSGTFSFYLGTNFQWL